MSKSKVLQSFDYSFDGIHALRALVGDEIDFLDMTDGLAAEGYVANIPEVVTPAPEVPVVEPVVDPELVPVVPPVEPEVVVPEVVTPAPEVKPSRKRR